MPGLINKYYYKIRIIITLSLVTASLFLVMSRISYFFVKDLYLDQLRDKISITSKMLVNQIDGNYFSLLELGMPTGSAKNYFNEIVQKNFSDDFHAKISIFNSNFEVLISTDSAPERNLSEPELLLYQNEISLLEVDKSVTSIPFKGNDDNWYLYGFYNIDNSNYLAIKAHAVRFNKIEEFDNLFWMISIGGILLIAIVSWLLSSSVLKPINKLVDFSKAIGSNDLNISPPEEMRGEMSILTNAMDAMRSNIASNHREREKILAQIAHEIRNPLGGIELLAELTIDDLKKNNIDTQYQEKVLGEIYRLKTLITSYLNYSKPSPVNPSMINLKEFIEDIKEIFSNKINQHNIILKEELEINEITFDKDQLKHILLNLIANSIESIEKEGWISISCRNINGYSEISVSDNGNGIDDENLENIFEPFFTTKENGTGLGLAICKKYAFENGAELSVINNDTGATFTLKKRESS